MLCKKCGSYFPDSAKFCPYCGADLNDERDSSKFNASKTKSRAGGLLSRLKNSMTPQKIAIIVAAVVVIVAAIVVIAILSNRRTEINLDQYVEITFTGYDTMGTAECEIDRDAFINDYSGKIKMTDEGRTVTGTSSTGGSYYDPAVSLVNRLYGSLNHSNDLSNGDQVTFKWSFNADEIESLYNVTLNYSDVVETVKGLTETKEYDVFQGVTISFSGISPDVSASISVDDRYLNENSFTLSQSTDLVAGDTVTVRITDPAEETLLSETGMYPAETSREYTVENVAHYITSLGEIPDSALDKMKAQAEDTYNANVANNWDTETDQFRGMTFLGCYYLEKKDLSDNMIYLIYKISATQFGKDENGNPANVDFDFYWYIRFSGGIVLEDGTFSLDYTDYSIPNGSRDAPSVTIITYDYTKNREYQQKISKDFAGCEDLDSLFSQLVTTEIEYYTYESTVAEEPAPAENPEDT